MHSRINGKSRWLASSKLSPLSFGMIDIAQYKQYLTKVNSRKTNVYGQETLSPPRLRGFGSLTVLTLIRLLSVFTKTRISNIETCLFEIHNQIISSRFIKSLYSSDTKLQLILEFKAGSFTLPVISSYRTNVLWNRTWKIRSLTIRYPTLIYLNCPGFEVKRHIFSMTRLFLTQRRNEQTLG